MLIKKTQDTVRLSAEEVYLFARWVSKVYECKTGLHLQRCGITFDDLASEVFLRLNRYNSHLIGNPVIGRILYRVCYQHCAYITSRVWHKRKKEIDPTIAPYSTNDYSAPSSYDSFHCVEQEELYDNILAQLEEIAKTKAEKRIVGMLKNISEYWDWASPRYKDARFPNVSRISKHLKIKYHETRKAIDALTPTVQKGLSQ